MFILVNAKSQWIEYYQGMICGVIAQVSPDYENAKGFKTETEALKERDANHAFLHQFRVKFINT